MEGKKVWSNGAEVHQTFSVAQKELQTFVMAYTEKTQDEVYNTLLNKDTSNMSQDQKAKHERALHKLEEKLFAD
jgi:hypothetical protein